MSKNSKWELAVMKSPFPREDVPSLVDAVWRRVCLRSWAKLFRRFWQEVERSTSVQGGFPKWLLFNEGCWKGGDERMEQEFSGPYFLRAVVAFITFTYPSHSSACLFVKVL